MNRLTYYSITAVMLCIAHNAFSMVYDNRFLFLAQRPFVTVEGRPSHFLADLFIETASKAVGPNESDIPLYELFGEFDQGKIARSFPLIGLQNPFITFGRPEWQDGTFKWCVGGKIQSQGVAFAYQQAITRWFSFGATWLFMRVHTFNDFKLEEKSIPLNQNEICELDEIRREMLAEINLNCNKTTFSNVGDIDMYMRFGYDWDYTLRFRRIIAGGRIGVLIPTGQRRSLNAPPSVPFGGEGYWGIYGALDAEFEAKEDWKVGLLFRISKRLRRTFVRRMPVDTEPQPFGLVVGPAQVNPGETIVFSPYLLFENLREGLGIRVQYTLTHHDTDLWRDRRPCECLNNPETKLEEVQRFSSWSSDYVTVAALYDFGKMKENRGFSPIVTLEWDIPVVMIVAHRAVKTHRIIFGIEFNF